MKKNNIVEDLLIKMGKLRSELNQKQIKRLKLDLLKRIIERLDDYDETCDICKEHLETIDDMISHDRVFKIFETGSFKEYDSQINNIIKHLEKQHKLIPNGYYMNQYMVLGMIFGTALGTVFNNIGLGISLGMCIGIVLGSSLDANAKKKGNVI